MADESKREGRVLPVVDAAATSAESRATPLLSMDRRQALKVMAIAAAAPTLATCAPGEEIRSFGDLKGFTKKVLPKASNPFLVVTETDSRKIDEVFKIRNYLAHYSASARRALDRVYKDQYALSRFQEPGRFLLASDGRRLWSYFDGFAGASARMKAWC